MKKLALGVIATTVAMASPLAAQDNYLFGFSDGHYTRQLELTTTAGSQIVSARDSGWFDQNGYHGASNQNYIVGTCVTCLEGPQYNNFFVFDLSTVSGTITGATLSAYNPDYISGVLSTWSVWDVSTPISSLSVSWGLGDATGQAIFNDFQSGTLFGSRTITNVLDGTLVSLDLNADAIASLNAGIGTEWAIGGTLREGYVIPGEPGPAIPEPATWAMMILGFFGVGSAVRTARRKERAAASRA